MRSAAGFEALHAADDHVAIFDKPCRPVVTPRAPILGPNAVYLSDASATEGATILVDQKRKVDAYTAAHAIKVDHYIVDSGRPAGNEAIGHGLGCLIAAVRAGIIRTIVVEHVSRLADDYAQALLLAACFAGDGVAIHEARGGPSRVDRDVIDVIRADATTKIRRHAAELERGAAC